MASDEPTRTRSIFHPAAGGLTRSPYSLALVLEAAGPTAMNLVGEILHRRFGLRD